MIFIEAIMTPSMAILSAKILELDTNGVFYLYVSLCALACLIVLPLKIPQDVKNEKVISDETIQTNIQ